MVTVNLTKWKVVPKGRNLIMIAFADGPLEFLRSSALGENRGRVSHLARCSKNGNCSDVYCGNEGIKNNFPEK